MGLLPHELPLLSSYHSLSPYFVNAMPPSHNPRNPKVASLRWKNYIRFEFSREIAMRYSAQVKPISYLKANAAEILLNLAEKQEPMVITQNGEAKAVIQDIVSFEQGQETLSLLKLLALGNQDIEAGRTAPARAVIDRLRSRGSGR